MDEADRLLDMGFKESLESILKVLPKQRRTGLFSATQTDEIDKLIRAGLRNPCNIQVKQKATLKTAQKTPVGLKNFFLVSHLNKFFAINILNNFLPNLKTVEPEDKFQRLIEFLKDKKSHKHLIFMNTCACVQYFTTLLKK